MRVLEQARRAPSAGFSQGLDLLVLDDPARVAWFWRATAAPGRSMAGGRPAPPVIVLVLADPERYLRRYAMADKVGLGLREASAWPIPYWDVDAGMAVMLALLTAVDLGLGAWFFRIPHAERTALDALGVPTRIHAVGAVGLGWPAAGDRPGGSPTRVPRRGRDEVVHRNAW